MCEHFCKNLFYNNIFFIAAPHFLHTVLAQSIKKKCKCVSGWGVNQSSGLASVSLETKVCLWASITLAHESRHLLEKKKSFFFFQGNTPNQHPGYKFAKCNTGLIVCWVDAGRIRIDPVPLSLSSSKQHSFPPPPPQNLSFLLQPSE